MGSQITLNRLLLQSKYLARQLTIPWVVCIVVFIAMIGFYVGAVIPTYRTVETMKSDLRTLQHNESRLRQASIESARRAPAGQLAEFNDAFPEQSVWPDNLERIVKIAQENGLNPKQAEYHFGASNAGALMAYQLTLPIKGPYPKILAFVFQLLAEIPNLALDNISFQRQKIGESVVDANLLLTLYFKRGYSVEQ